MASQYTVGEAEQELVTILPAIGGSRRQLALKRCVDLVLAGAGLIALAPLFLIIAVLIKLDSAGPVFYVQSRVGSRRREVAGEGEWIVDDFRMFKFRSMRQDASERMHQEHIRAYANGAARSEDGLFKLNGDPRVTRLGKWLRRSSVDELPQLINVLRGEMSLVGPRPVPPYEAACYERRHFQRLCALPGVSGWWQVHGRGRTSFEEMIEMDVQYARKQSLKLDLTLLALTLPAIISGKGAR